MKTDFAVKQKIKIGIDFHNLSTQADKVVRTGIQQVVFNLLNSHYILRTTGQVREVEIIPLPVLPIVNEPTDFTESNPNQVNNSYHVLQESARELNVSLSDLWNFDFADRNWTDEQFFNIAGKLDWIILTGLCDFRTVIAKIKILNPELHVAILIYDLIPFIIPQLTASGMPAWFEDSYLDGLRYYADLLFTISKHTAIDCEQFLRGHLGRNIPIVSTTLPPEIPEFVNTDVKRDTEWLQKFNLKPQRYFVCLGTIEPRKNLGLAVRGFIEFHRHFTAKSEYKLCMIGKAGWSNEDAALQKEIGDLKDKFVFPGYLDRVSVEKIVHYSSGLAMPSRYEGFGMPLTLAHQHGVRTVSTIVSSLPEATQLGAAFVKPENVQEMMLAFNLLTQSSAKTTESLQKARDLIRREWDVLLANMINEIVHYKSVSLPAPKKISRRKKIVFEVHNLSILPNILQKTGIQEVAHSILQAVASVRSKYEDQAEILCVPFIPDLGYVMQFSATFNCDPGLLKTIEEISGFTSQEFWGFDLSKYGYSLSAYDFGLLVQNADHFVVTTQYDINRLLPKLKQMSPEVSVSAIVYDIIPTLYPNAVVPGLSNWFTHTLLRSFRNNISRAFGISRSAALDFINNAEGENLDAEVYALRLPINQSSITVTEDSDVLKKLALTPTKYFVVLGNNDPRKNVAECINGFILFCKLFPKLAGEYSLLLIGPKGWLTDAVTIAMANSRGRCHIVESGYLPDKDMHMAVKNAASVLMPSHYEGFGIPLALARSYGVPTLTCINSSLPEVTDVNAIFVNPTNSTEIALGLKTVLKNPRQARIQGDNWKQYVSDLIEKHL